MRTRADECGYQGTFWTLRADACETRRISWPAVEKGRVRMNAGRFHGQIGRKMHADECGAHCQLHVRLSAR